MRHEKLYVFPQTGAGRPLLREAFINLTSLTNHYFLIYFVAHWIVFNFNEISQDDAWEYSAATLKIELQNATIT